MKALTGQVLVLHETEAAGPFVAEEEEVAAAVAGEKEGALVRGRRVHELVEEHAEVEADLGGEVRALVALLVKVGLDAVHVVGERLEEGLCHK